MNRSTAQSLSRNMAGALFALEAATQQCRNILSVMRVLGSPSVAQVEKELKKLKAKRASLSVLQWKLKKAMMGNPSYITAADLNALRAFMKVSINLWEEVFSDKKAEKNFKTAKVVRKAILREGKQQREIRNLIIQYGHDSKPDRSETTAVEHKVCQ